MLEKYPDKVKLIFKNFPLRKHQFSKQAAIAAFAAKKQGKFWEFHDRLVDNFDKLSDVKVVEIALELGLDLEQFEKDTESYLIVARINQDIRLGARAGVRGTPTVFINGRVSRARTLEALQAAVEKELEKSRKPLTVSGEQKG